VVVSGGQRTLQRAEYAVARILSESEEPVETYARVLAAIGELLGWELGAAWEVGPTGDRLRCVATWHQGDAVAEFEALSERMTFRAGEGLPGRVWESGEPLWLSEPPTDDNFPRADIAARAGLHAAFCFPLRDSRGVVGAIEFFSRELREPDAELLGSMTVHGSQIGQYVARLRAEREVRASESRVRAMLQSSLDAVVAMDHRGIVVEWNHAAETTFGYTAAEALGREMVEMIVPPSLRDEHRRGFARYLETGDPRVLDRRLELSAIRSDGSEFPVELAITRIAQPGPPMFTAYLRDITERAKAEAELRASRVRLVEAADAERRRIERNLHDGAQQHIVLLGLSARRARDLLDADPAAAATLLEGVVAECDVALDALRELASGIHPAVLTERGLGPALAGLAERAAVPVSIGGLPRERLPESVEVAVYYVVAEALANVAKHARATAATVTSAVADGTVTVAVADDGIGGAGEAEGTGLRGLADRVQALGGSLELESPAGGGTRLSVRIPLA